jgi:DNA-binding NarL/FixJ family response regulator
MSRVRLVLADERRLYLAALQSLLETGFEVTGTATSSSEMLWQVEKLKPDVLVSHIPTGGRESIQQVRLIHRKFPEIGIVVLVDDVHSGVCSEAVDAGASACVRTDEDAEALSTAIELASRRRSFLESVVNRSVNVNRRSFSFVNSGLTSQQLNVLRLLVTGLPQKEIAARLHVSPKTVEFHKYRMMKQLGVKSSAELIVVAVRKGLVLQDPD